MKPEIVHDILLPACLAVFPPKYNTLDARAMLLAIGLQESGFQHRRQLLAGVTQWWRSNGPAMGYWQFERTGVRGVMEHPGTRGPMRQVCEKLGYPMDLEVLYQAIQYDIVLAVAVARLALWADPAPLPRADQPSVAWSYYLRTWRPGKPKPGTWLAHYQRAWHIVLAGGE